MGIRAQWNLAKRRLSGIVSLNRLMTAGDVSKRICLKGTFVSPVEVHLKYF